MAGQHMHLTVTVQVALSREAGKFASKDEVADQVREAIDDANPGEVSGVGADSDSTYVVDEWDVEVAA